MKRNLLTNSQKTDKQKKSDFYILFVLLKRFFFVLFLVILATSLTIRILFPKASLNQIIFHALYLDKEQLFAYKEIIALTIILCIICGFFIKKWPRYCIPIIILIYLFNPLLVSNIKEDKSVPFWKHLYLSFCSTDLYKKHYISPRPLSPTSSPKNIIVIFAESMESTFTDATVFGENLIPYLSKLEEEGTVIRGYKSINGTNWTLASNVATLCAVPLRMQLRDRLGAQTKQFMPNITCITDLLKHADYHNVFLTGTYLNFVGTNVFTDEHSFHEMFGRDELLKAKYATKKDIGIQNYGINDTTVFKFAREKLSELEKNKKPFFMAIQTLDTHFPKGYVHPGCPIRYGDTRDAIKCSDKIIYDFVKWCQKQKFYENSVIFIVGDHLMMLSSDIAPLLEKVQNREIYNIILSPQENVQVLHKSHSQFDWAATIADKAGISPFGLGRSLLQNKPTLVEELGAEYLENELLKNSDEYSHFLGIK